MTTSNIAKQIMIGVAVTIIASLIMNYFQNKNSLAGTGSTPPEPEPEPGYFSGLFSGLEW